MARKRILKKTIFIACEGTNTEPLYFEKIKEIQEDEDSYPFSLTIYPDKEFHENPKTDALGLIKVAIDCKDDFDEVWVVFDKDGYTKHPEAFKLAEENGVNIAFSSIAFELWILLHFERTNQSYTKSANIINEKFNSKNNYLINYTKSGDFNVMPLILDKMETAYRNASWLRKKNKEDKIYNLNPYTDVDILVKRITLNDKLHHYLNLDEIIICSNIEISLTKKEGTICFKIKNNSNISIVTNSFKFINAENEKIELPNSLVEINKEVVSPLFKENKYGRIFIHFDNQIIEVEL